MMHTARDFDVSAVRSPINPGIYAGDRKLGSVGIAIRHGIAFHGFALNSSLSLEPFQWIAPCGLKNIEMTSLERETTSSVSMDVVRTSAQRHFWRLFGISPVPIERKKLELMVAKPTL
jgi:lipoate-protein ligase B